MCGCQGNTVDDDYEIIHVREKERAAWPRPSCCPWHNFQVVKAYMLHPLGQSWLEVLPLFSLLQNQYIRFSDILYVLDVLHFNKFGVLGHNVHRSPCWDSQQLYIDSFVADFPTVMLCYEFMLFIIDLICMQKKVYNMISSVQAYLLEIENKITLKKICLNE